MFLPPQALVQTLLEAAAPCEGASGSLSWVCVGRYLQGTKNIGAGPGEWAIQMPQAQSLTSLSLNFY